MKGLILLLLLLVTSCSLPTFDFDYEELWKSVEDTFINCVMPDREFENISQVIQWTYTHITYATDLDMHGEENYAQPPYETEVSRQGDCEDFSIHAMYYLYDSLNISRDNIFLITGKRNGENIHAWVSVNGVWWDPVSGSIAEDYVTRYDEFICRSYYEVMYLSYVYRRL